MKERIQKISIQVRMPPALLETLDKTCKSQHRSRAAEIIMRLEASFANDVNQHITVASGSVSNTQ